MRLFGYYAWHSFVGQIKKIFRTWVIIFMLVCVAGGGGAGLLAGMTADKVEDTQIAREKENPKEADKEKPTDSFQKIMRSSGLKGREFLYVFTAAGVIILLLFFMGSADAGGKIFLPADVSLLFASPMKPQSVLMFRLFARMGTFVFLTLYVVIMNLQLADMIGMNGFMIVMLVIAWILMFVTAKLFQIIFYLGCEEHPVLKKSLRYIVLGIAVLLFTIICFYKKASGLPIGTAVNNVLNFRGSFIIPVYGWLKSIVYYSADGKWALSVAFAAVSVVVIIALVYLIYHVKADFYESAMEQTAVIAARIEKSNESKLGFSKEPKAKKHSHTEIISEGLGHGRGASVFFFKSMHNRWRSAGRGILTKTSVTYIVATIIAGFFAKGQWSANPATAAFMVLMAFVFYRSMGNPLEEDTRMGFYRMIPESPWKKLFFSLISGTVNCCMDILPSLILIAVLFRPSVYLFLMGTALIITIDFYATTVSVFLDSSIPQSVDKMVRQIVQATFLMFGLLPDAIILVVGYMNDHLMANLPYCIIVNVVVGMILFAITPIVMEDMRVRVTRPSADQFEGDLRSIKKNISRIGFGMVLIIVFSAVSQIAVSAIVQHFKWILDTSWGTWIVTMLPEYLIGFPIGYAVIRKVKPETHHDRSLGRKNFLMAVPSSVFMTVAGALTGRLILWLIGLLHPVQTTSAVEMMAGQGSVLLRILFMVILAPLIEEFIFRKTLIDRLRPYGETTAIFSSALAFGLFHGNFSQMFYAFGIGLIFGTIYEKTGRLRYSLALHMIINFTGGIIAPMVASGIKADALITELPVSVIIYAAVYYGLAIIGIATFFISYARVGFRKQAMELPKGAAAETVYGNPGMIAFFIACAVLVIIQTF